MWQWIRNRLLARRVAKLERLTELARELDELLGFGRLSEATRQKLQARRDDVQQRAREVMFG